MKKILFLALMGLWSVQYVAAQRKGGNARTPEQMVEKLDQKLNLTDEQEKQIVALYTDALKQDLSREERKAAMCRKRSIPTHSERLNPSSFTAKLALKSA